MIRLAATVAALAAALVVSGAGGAASRVDAACSAGELSGSFSLVPGSPGAGNVVYALRLTNRSARTCFVTGIPGLRLLDRHGQALPTHVIPVHRGALTAVIVRLLPHQSAKATARFSPDVPGVGETGKCEPVSYKLRVTPSGGGTLVVAVRPPTRVCEHGSLQMTVLVKASS
jgi:hypothetical protein